MNDYTPESGDKEKEIIELARERRKACIESEFKSRQKSEDDVRFAAGFQWPESIEKTRDNQDRPCLTINKTGQYVRQVVNDARQNTPAIRVFPVGSGSDKETAEVFNGLIRDCEQRTDADIAYDTAIESCARAGEGYFRLISRYIEDQPKVGSKDAFEQEIAFQRIRSYATVHIDPSALCPAGSDMEYCFVDEWWSEKLFREKYGEPAMAGLDNSGLGEHAPNWLHEGNILVADYYSLEKDQSRTLAMLKSGAQVILEEQAEPVNPDNIVAQRKINVTRCVFRKITGNTVLEKTIWPCRFIPVFRVIGEEFEVDGDVYYQGLIRPMKDSQRMYNYWMSTATEKGALESKAPYIGAEGQFEGHEHEWKVANRVPFAYLEYKPIDIDGTLAPPPQRNVSSFAGAADIQMAQLASEDMNATTGIYRAALGGESNEKSGRALIAKQREADTSTFHYIDNLSRAIRHCGRVMVEVLPKYLSNERIVRIVGEDEQDEMVMINSAEKDNAGNILKRINDITIGRYDVRVDIGPSYTTKRQESADSMLQFVQAVPSAGQAVMDLLAKSMDWPGAEMIAERLRKLLPPGLADEDENEGVPVEQVQQMIQQAMEQMAQQFQASLEEREVAVKEYEAFTKRISAIENSFPDEGQLREQIASVVAELLSKVQPQTQGNQTQ